MKRQPNKNNSYRSNNTQVSEQYISVAIILTNPTIFMAYILLFAQVAPIFFNYINFQSKQD